MARPGSSKFLRIIARLFSTGSTAAPKATHRGAAAEAPAIRFPQLEFSSVEEIDRQWLERTELRSLEDVAKYLEGTDFSRMPGMTTALFLDNRCGLIRSEDPVQARPSDPEAAASCILRKASNCQAHAIMLATFDPSGEAANALECRQLTSALMRKGEATGVLLLNHFALTRDGWKSVHPGRSEGRSEASGETDCPWMEGRPISNRIRRAFRQAQSRLSTSGSTSVVTPGEHRKSSHANR